ncbi:hypothetical protein FKM82_026147, partial [Ascaphus truei]
DLVLKSCDLDCETNNRAHRTVDTGCHALVVRRGQSFHITLRFSNRKYQEGVDQLALNVHTVHRPGKKLGTKTHIPVSDALKEAAWSAAVSSNKEGALVLSVFSPPDAHIGRYNLSLEASSGNQAKSFQLGEFALLFNPWCPEDSVYLDDEERRKEYVLTQHGLIFQGTIDSIDRIPWIFGQVKTPFSGPPVK